jgi:hypothetical protein
MPGLQDRQVDSPAISGLPHLPQKRATRSVFKLGFSPLGAPVSDGLFALHMRQLITASGF